MTNLQAGVAGGTQNVLVTNGFDLPQYDYLTLTQATLTDTYNFLIGGSGGALVATLVITYTDSGKQTIANVARTV